MRISRTVWLVFGLLAVFCLGLWYRFGYPRFSFIHLAVDKSQAVMQAEECLRALDVDPDDFLTAVEFRSDQWADRYLQQTLRVGAAEAFIEKYRYDIFTWNVRFFKEMDKEEYALRVSPRSGEIVAFYHLIDDIAPRPDISEEAALRKAQDFLGSRFGFDPRDYVLHEKKIQRYDRRVDHLFSWERTDVYIPWRSGTGGAKLLSAAVVSGDEVREFYKYRLDIPEKFERFVDRQFVLADWLYSVYFLVFMTLIGISVAVIIKKRGTFALLVSRKLYFFMGSGLFLINIFYVFNNLQEILIRYPTSSSIISFFGMYFVRLGTEALFMTVMFLIPGLSAEALRRESFPEHQAGSFARYAQTGFLTREVASLVLLGYLFFVILLGTQSVIFYFGQKYLGVWKEWIKMTRYSSAYLPFLSAFAMAVSASLTEEIVYRLFGISLLKRYTRSTIVAVVAMAFLWGFGHSEYAIFPVWFRGMEVSLVGILFGFIFVRWGLIPLLVAHYLFDAFWGIAAHLLGHTTPALFTGAFALFLIPLAWAVWAFVKNNPSRASGASFALDKIQAYNLRLLTVFIAHRKSEGIGEAQIKEELLAHNWDVDLVDLALQKAE